MSPAAIILGACSPSLCPSQPQGTSFACLVFPTDAFSSKCFRHFNWKDCFHSSCSTNVHSLKLGFMVPAGHQATVRGSREASTQGIVAQGPGLTFRGEVSACSPAVAEMCPWESALRVWTSAPSHYLPSGGAHALGV